MKRVALHTLGCKVNAYETEIMRQSLREKGYHIVPFEEVADIYIINTCTVTNIADRKSRQMLHRVKQRNPQAVVVAVGCYVQTGRNAVEKDDSVDLAVGNNCKKEIVSILEKYLKERQEDSCKGIYKEERKKSHIVIGMDGDCGYEETQLRHAGEHTRAFVKIQDGCNQFCAYCVIPYARGRVRSRRCEDIITEIEGLVKTGCKEVVLTGIHISSYGIDFEEEAWKNGVSQTLQNGGKKEYTGSSKLIDLVERIHKTEGLERIRLGSLEPRIITEDTARRLCEMPKVCPHFHLSLQSGCDATLKRMNRRYTVGEYYTSVEMLRKYFSHVAVTTDVIVGFPGETEEEFSQTKAFLEKVSFYEMHIFKYSRREGTRAASMLGQVPESEKAWRSGELIALEAGQSREFRWNYIGRKAEVLLEEEQEINGRVYLVGHTRDYVKVAVDTHGMVENTLVWVEVKGFLTDEILIGEK